MNRAKYWVSRLFPAVAFILLAAASGQGERLFEADSKTSGNSKMDIIIKETERRPQVSVIEIKINNAGSSVGSSFFLLCSIRKLAIERGQYHYIVKLEEIPKRHMMTIAFLERPDEDISGAGPEFTGITPGKGVIDLEQFAPICGMMK
ncbi:MAG: hypothetical protein HZB29_11375 [Nitrospinae bacterium]|nr:hypothetical protein [Nitrospinota bacterium]